MNFNYPLLSYICSLFIAQGVKPLIMLFKTKKFSLKYAFSSGGYPSAHSAGVTSLALSIGIKEGFNSSLFAISFVLAVIVIYDAFNVRWYAGRNIKLTRQLVIDLKDKIDLNDPIYNEKLKDVLGHTKLEIITGILLGIIVALVVYLIWR